MNAMDSVLSKVGKEDDGLGKNWSPIERVVHHFHMGLSKNFQKKSGSGLFLTTEIQLEIFFVFFVCRGFVVKS